MLNSADGLMYVEREVLALINSDGLVKYMPSGLFKVSCSFDLTEFPL